MKRSLRLTVKEAVVAVVEGSFGAVRGVFGCGFLSKTSSKKNAGQEKDVPVRKLSISAPIPQHPPLSWADDRDVDALASDLSNLRVESVHDRVGMVPEHTMPFFASSPSVVYPAYKRTPTLPRPVWESLALADSSPEAAASPECVTESAVKPHSSDDYVPIQHINLHELGHPLRRHELTYPFPTSSWMGDFGSASEGIVQSSRITPPPAIQYSQCSYAKQSYASSPPPLPRLSSPSPTSRPLPRLSSPSPQPVDTYRLREPRELETQAAASNVYPSESRIRRVDAQAISRRPASQRSASALDSGLEMDFFCNVSDNESATAIFHTGEYRPGDENYGAAHDESYSEIGSRGYSTLPRLRLEDEDLYEQMAEYIHEQQTSGTFVEEHQDERNGHNENHSPFSSPPIGIDPRAIEKGPNPVIEKHLCSQSLLPSDSIERGPVARAKAMDSSHMLGLHQPPVLQAQSQESESQENSLINLCEFVPDLDYGTSSAPESPENSSVPSNTDTTAHTSPSSMDEDMCDKAKDQSALNVCFPLVAHTETHLCQHCGEAYDFRGELNRHINRHHVRRYKCDACRAAFHLNADLKRHKATVHKESQSAFSCPNDPCTHPGKTFNRRDNFKRHVSRCSKEIQSQH
ncbi:hypothetical protein BS50DRAFT_670490 [Corynespora cassiicola Philippines]|uniref:C2H2-type domain-containing protein n=1 Tax=Corynespora cassiicola Philippines TaxID=1448308 RepID=A0A2T2P9H0_CORCC|nr:hypothetical protein BS50DRAFT_670490 [Corynespora cassiicola Philippines]